MDKIIVERCNGELIVIDGKGYTRDAVESWTLDELAKFRDKLILKAQKDYKDYEQSVYDAFQPYIMKAEVKEARRGEKRNLAQMIRRMPEEDVIAVFTIYFDEILNKKNGSNEKNENH